MNERASDEVLAERMAAIGAASEMQFDCVACEREYLEKQSALTQFFGRHFIVCPACGNKRCPKATHHDNACTGSNDPGQEGSAYE